MTFSRQPNDFRDRTIVKSLKDQWNKLTISGPQIVYTLSKQGMGWMIDGLATDSITTENYLSSLSRLYSPDFVEPSVLQSDNPSFTISIEGENMQAPIKVFAYKADTTNGFAISSSMNPGTYFSGNKSGLFDKTFPEKERFFPKEPEL
jgi:hypothetical protein